jgi:NADPH:quinone reductase-like Zn-dependent oxidoreductase
MQGTGLLVLGWPWVVGCDAAGVVVKVGETAASVFKEGDEVCGCTRLGSPGYSTGQEYVSRMLRVV